MNECKMYATKHTLSQASVFVWVFTVACAFVGNLSALESGKKCQKNIYNVYMYVCAYIMEASKKLFQQSNVTTRRYCCT